MHLDHIIIPLVRVSIGDGKNVLVPSVNALRYAEDGVSRGEMFCAVRHFQRVHDGGLQRVSHVMIVE